MTDEEKALVFVSPVVNVSPSFALHLVSFISHNTLRSWLMSAKKEKKRKNIKSGLTGKAAAVCRRSTGPPNVERHTSHETFSRRFHPCAHTTLWLKVSQCAFHSIHMPFMMSHV